MLTVHLHLSLDSSKSHPPVSCQLWNRTSAIVPSSPMHHLQWIAWIFSLKHIAFFISSHQNLTTHYFFPISMNTPQELTGKKWAILSRESSRVTSDLSLYIYSFKSNLPVLSSTLYQAFCCAFISLSTFISRRLNKQILVEYLGFLHHVNYLLLFPLIFM